MWFRVKFVTLCVIQGEVYQAMCYGLIQGEDQGTLTWQVLNDAQRQSEIMAF